MSAKQPEEIRREIEETQARLGESVEALAQQKTQAKENVKETIVEKATEAKETVKDKVVGKKDEWSAKAADKKSEVAEMAAKAKDKVVESAEATKEKVKSGVGSAKERMASTTDEDPSEEPGPSRMERARESVTAKKDAVASKVKDALPDTGALKEKAKGVASSTLAKLPDREDLKRRAGKAGAAVAENPAVLALGSLAAGLLVGLAVPLTRTERQKVGPYASQVRVRAITTGTRAAAEQVTQKVDRGVDAVTQQVTEKITEGLDTLADHLQGTAEKVGFGDVVQSVKERAKESVTALADEVAERAKGKATEVVEKGKEKVAQKEGGEEPEPPGTPAPASASPEPASPQLDDSTPATPEEGPTTTRRYLH